MGRETLWAPTMTEDSSPSQNAPGAGGLGGTAFASLVLLMPPGKIQSVLLILAPSITILISMFWKAVTDEIGEILAEWKMRFETLRVERMCIRIENNPHASEELRAQARSTLAAVMMAEVTRKEKLTDMSQKARNDTTERALGRPE